MKATEQFFPVVQLLYRTGGTNVFEDFDLFCKMQFFSKLKSSKQSTNKE